MAYLRLKLDATSAMRALSADLKATQRRAQVERQVNQALGEPRDP
jgi:hypothetical protein